jgi:hypothetical protein
MFCYMLYSGYSVYVFMCLLWILYMYTVPRWWYWCCLSAVVLSELFLHGVPVCIYTVCWCIGVGWWGVSVL